MSDRLPPNSPEAERGALACLLLAPEQAKAMLTKLQKPDFYELRHQEIFSAILCLVIDGTAPDLVSLFQWLKDKGRLESAGGLDYLQRLPDAAPSSGNFESYFEILKDKARRRVGLQIASRVSELCYNEAADPYAVIQDAKAAFDSAVAKAVARRKWFHFYTPSECRSYDPPQGLVLVGDCHVVRGAVTVIAGPPGVGKSRSGHALAISGATGTDWLGLNVHRQFRTAILQNENGRYRLKKEFAEIDVGGLDEFVRITDPPPFGMAFDNPEYRAALAAWFEEWLPDLVVFDPWNSAARDDGQRDYWSLFQALKEVLPKGDAAPALVIVAHTRKPKRDEGKTGRGLLNEVAGSYVLVSVPRTIFIMQHASDDPQDDTVVWTCSKNNDGELGIRTAWYRRNGLFVPCHDFDWKAFDGPEGGGRQTITQAHMEKLFEGGRRRLLLKNAAEALDEISGLKHSACYKALNLTGRFSVNLKEDSEGLLCWRA